MYKKFFIGIAVWMFLALGFLNVSFAANSAVGTSPSDDDVREINNATPGTSKTFLGTRLKGPMTTGETTYASGDNGNAVGHCAAGTAGFATPTTVVFFKTSGAATGESYCLGNGTYNQTLTAVLVTDGGKDFVITPLTKTGFTSVTLDDAKDTVTLKWSGTHWYISGNNGATVN